MRQEPAEEIARDALIWLAGNEELLPIFMGSTGVGATEIRENAHDPAFLGAVLDFLLLDDAWVTSFCTESGLGFDMPLHARHALPGGSEMHWT